MRNSQGFERIFTISHWQKVPKCLEELDLTQGVHTIIACELLYLISNRRHVRRMTAAV